jgi:hypothetical protein
MTHVALKAVFRVPRSSEPGERFRAWHAFVTLNPRRIKQDHLVVAARHVDDVDAARRRSEERRHVARNCAQPQSETVHEKASGCYEAPRGRASIRAHYRRSICRAAAPRTAASCLRDQCEIHGGESWRHSERPGPLGASGGGRSVRQVRAYHRPERAFVGRGLVGIIGEAAAEWVFDDVADLFGGEEHPGDDRHRQRQQPPGSAPRGLLW